MEPRTKTYKKRDAILTCLRATDTHPSAEDVHRMLQAEHPDISMATVYLNLSLFKEQGIIQSRDGLWWTAKPRPVAALPLGGSERISLSDGENAGVFRGHTATAFCCPTCKKIVLEY